MNKSLRLARISPRIDNQIKMNTNVDHSELDKFNSVASRWWDPQGEFKPLHRMNPLRLHYINSRTPLKEQSVLDVGCGGGLLSEAMAAVGANVIGIDLATDALEVAKLHLLESGYDIEYQQIAIEELTQHKPTQFDVITCLEMLEHVPEPASVINACAELVKPGGSVYFSTINRTAKSYLMAIVGAEYVLKLLPKGTHEHKKFIRPSELDQWARHSGLMLKHSTGIHFNPVTEQFWLAPNLDVNYISWFVKS